MRQFVVVGHEAPVVPDFSLDNLAGGAGRLDLLCRCVGAGLFLSHGIRDDARVHLVLQDARTVTFDGADLRNARPDERTLAGLVRSALDAAEDAVGHRAVESSPGVTVSKRGLKPTLEDVARRRTVVHLHEDGDPLPATDPPADPVFVLSDHRDFTDDEMALLDDAGDRRVSLGPKAIHADHATAVAHNYLDTDGYDADAY
ncbi:MAG: tRNA (pseudouridine(54)-N(1))-methyltransferase TrmY [Halobacteriaceae archaeon]